MQMAINRRHANRGFESQGVGHQPSIRMPRVDLNPRQRLVNQRIVLQGLNVRYIAAEFFAPIKSFGRLGKDFDDDGRVKENVLELIVKLRLPAIDRDIGVGEHPLVRFLLFEEWSAAYFHIWGESLARLSA